MIKVTSTFHICETSTLEVSNHPIPFHSIPFFIHKIKCSMVMLLPPSYPSKKREKHTKYGMMKKKKEEKKICSHALSRKKIKNMKKKV